jgi:uncharacterized membrane protein YgcG
MERPSPCLRVLPALVATLLAVLLGLLLVSVTTGAGPPFPEPVEGQRVYDPADAIRPQTESWLEDRIAEIEARTGAQIAIYLQRNPGVSPDRNEANARALMDQWGVGRAGFDDGLVILFDLEPSLVNGRVAIWTGSGFRAVYLDDDAIDRVLDDVMIPRLRAQDVDGALVEAIRAIDARMDAGGALRLERARILDALLTLAVAPLVLLGTLGMALIAWYRSGRDPRFLDSESILMAGPPAGMTPSLAVVVRQGRSSLLSLTVALMELGRRGFVRFAEGGREGLAIELLGDDADSEPHRRLGSGQRYLLDRLRALLGSRAQDPGADWTLDAKSLARLHEDTDEFHRRVEREAVDLGWFAEKPRRAIMRWSLIGGGELVVGGVLLTIGLLVPIYGLALVGGAFVLGGLGTMLLAQWMPQRTAEGARVDGMLKAYRRTLRKTLEQARSMEQVVADPVVHSWADTPDKAMVWGIALGLHAQVARVLERSLEDRRKGVTQDTWYPRWVSSPSSGGSWATGSTSAAGRGLFSPSPIPNVGAMLAAIGTVGRAPSSSGGSGGGGGSFGGGSSGGGGGGSRGF